MTRLNVSAVHSRWLQRLVYVAPCCLALACGSTSSGSSAGQVGASAGGASDSGGTGGVDNGGAAGTSSQNGGAGGAGAGTAGNSAAGTTSSAGSGGSGGAAVTCDLSPVPTDVPMLTSEFIQVDSTMNIGPPTMAGGDVTGTWLFTKITVFLPESAKGEVDATMSTVMGTGWTVLGSDGTFRLSLDISLSIDTTIVGVIAQTSTNDAKGTYVTSGTFLTPTVTCSTSTQTGSEMIEFTHVAGAPTGQYLLHTMGQMGKIDLLLDGNVSP